MENEITVLFNDTHKENCVLLNSAQELIKIEVWLLLIFFLYLRNRLVSTHFIVPYLRI